MVSPVRRSPPRFVLSLLLFLGVLAPATAARAAGCAPVSATITYSADDYLSFWINGNQVLNGTVFDAGNPPVTVAIPVGDFSAAGTPNYFAAKDVNSVANLIGATWLISITCADGSVSYITAGDTNFVMYDDLNGAAPPPVNGGLNWYQPAWVDAGNLFNQTPVQTNGIAWFNPNHLTNPITGAQSPVLSHSTSGVQNSLAEVLYFRESVVLPEYTLTPTPTPTPSPTHTPTPSASPTPWPTSCGTPNEQAGGSIIDGCTSGGAATVSFANPGGPGQLLLVFTDEEGGSAITSLTANGSPLSPVETSGTMEIWALKAPPVGAVTITISRNNACSFEAGYALWDYIDQVTPYVVEAVQSSTANAFNDEPQESDQPDSFHNNDLGDCKAPVDRFFE